MERRQSPRSKFFFIRIGITLAVILMIFPLTGATPDRFSDLGHRMMCSCGCGQVLLECNHVGCTRSDGMRQELQAGIDRGDNDDLILQGFVQKYGSTILAAPTTKGFNRVAWIMPFVALLAGLLVAVLYIRSLRKGPVGPLSGSAEIDGLRARVREETES